MAKEARQRRLLVALAAALSLHAGAAALLMLLAQRAPRPRHQRSPVAIELREAKKAEPPAAPLHAGPPTAQAVRAVRGSFTSRPSSATKREERPAAGGDSAAGLSIVLRDPGAVLGREGAAPVPSQPERAASRAERRGEEEARVKGRVEAWVEEDLAHLRVLDGRDAYWQHVEDELARGFRVEWNVLDEGPGGRSGPARVLGEAALAWQRAAAAYGRSGNPAPAGSRESGVRRSLAEEWTGMPAEERGYRGDLALGTSLSPSIGVGVGGSPQGPFHHRLVVHLMVVQAEGGGIEAVHVQVSSGNERYDALAVARARDLAQASLGAPPRDRRRSLWSFETDFVQVPPLPIAGCALDALLIPRECYYPLKKTVKSRLHLEALY